MSFLTGVLGLAVVLLIWRLYQHRHHLRQMLVWLDGPLDAPLPDAHGRWGEFVSAMNRRVKTRRREADTLAAGLEQFRSALEALPDGVIFMDAQRRILWMNPLAAQLMALSAATDLGKPIEHLVREPEFVAYLRRGDFSEALLHYPARHHHACYQLHVIDYGDARALLTIRDLTRLEKLENLRRDFVANVSHELKTPLTVIGGFIETLQAHHDTIDATQRQRYLDLAFDQAQHMNRLVADLLTLSSLEASARLADEREVAVAALIDELIATTRNLPDATHQISNLVPPTLRLRGAATALRSILGNLIDNAVNYTPAGGSITISWEASADGGAVCIHDTGIGIAPEHLPRLTERFYRVDPGRSRQTGGTGLGLAIVKHALTRHQGHLSIESQAGVGSRFAAYFPAARILQT